MSSAAQKVQDALSLLGFNNEVVELSQSTRSAAEAAAAVGCEVGQIAKSLIFRCRSGAPVLVIASGANRVDERLLAEAVGEPIQRATPEFVRQHTGFAIGGVPPVGHPEKIETLVDIDLLEYSEIWAAAGSPLAVFRLTPDELVRMTGARVLRIKQSTVDSPDAHR